MAKAKKKNQIVYPEVLDLLNDIRQTRKFPLTNKFFEKIF